MTPAQQATADLHAAFWNIPYADTLAALHTITPTLPARQHNLTTGEIKELKELGMARLGKEKRDETRVRRLRRQ
jgi:hypothetical protein